MLFDYDFFMIETGEIFMTYGNYRDDICRARLSYIPCQGGDKTILGKPYEKIRVQCNTEIKDLEKVMNAPGEEHFLIPKEKIVHFFSPQNAYKNLNEIERSLFDRIVATLNPNGEYIVSHGLTGSSVLNNRRPGSDFDWIIYGDMSDFEHIFRNITDSHKFVKKMFDAMPYIYERYRVYEGMTPYDLLKLYKNKWKFVSFEGMDISFFFTDRKFFCDKFLRLNRCGNLVSARGTVVSNPGFCSCNPKLVELNTDQHGIVRVISWMHLYSGAFLTGDNIEVVGELCKLDGQDIILVQESSHYIKLA